MSDRTANILSVLAIAAILAYVKIVTGYYLVEILTDHLPPLLD